MSAGRDIGGMVLNLDTAIPRVEAVAAPASPGVLGLVWPQVAVWVTVATVTIWVLMLTVRRVRKAMDATVSAAAAAANGAPVRRHGRHGRHAMRRR